MINTGDTWGRQKLPAPQNPHSPTHHSAGSITNNTWNRNICTNEWSCMEFISQACMYSYLHRHQLSSILPKIFFVQLLKSWAVSRDYVTIIVKNSFYGNVSTWTKNLNHYNVIVFNSTLLFIGCFQTTILSLVWWIFLAISLHVFHKTTILNS